MNHELKTLLKQQPDGWPRWQSGLDADDQIDACLHLFALDPITQTWTGTLGRPVALCQFIGGAHPIRAVRHPIPEEKSRGALCSLCVTQDLDILLSKSC